MKNDEKPVNKPLDIALSVLLGLGIAAAMVALCVYVLNIYGAILFIATPLVASCASAFLFSRRHPNEYGAAFWVCFLTLMLPFCLMLLAGLEGLICIAMALLPAAVFAALGAVIGQLAESKFKDRSSHLAIAIFLLPLAAGVETVTVAPALNEVVTTIEIAAPPEVVWTHVIGYSSLPEPREALFRTGVGYPRKVWMEGAGVGATRYCGFSTGTYVEPITRWEPPYRLSFDVTNIPPAMKELSFYDHVQAPHLSQTPRNRRGEFRLTRLDGNRTRLEGTTWYEIEMYPQFYWRWWADSAMHAIHERVFNHIRQASEREATSKNRSLPHDDAAKATR